MTSAGLSVADAALILNHPRRTVQHWAQVGTLPARKVGGRWVVSEMGLREMTGGDIDPVRSGIETAVTAAERLRGDVNAAVARRLRWGEASGARDWDAVADDLDRLAAAVAGVRTQVERLR